MKRFYFLYLLIFCAACSPGYQPMSVEKYQEVRLGMTPMELEAMLGKPYRTEKVAGGLVHYIYVERIVANSRVAEERHYYFIFEDKKLVDKKVVTKTEPEFLQRRTMELQTSQREESQEF